MAITLPDPEDLDVFSHDATDIFSEGQKVQAITQAGDLFYLATRTEEDPDDAAILRILSWGLLDMAWKLLVSTENKTETYSPYSSERIGSYSYSKMMQAATNGSATEVEWFDAAVKLVNGGIDDASAVFLQTENIFTQPYEGYTEEVDFLPMPDWFGR